MYDKLGFDWASSLVGFIALALAVVPWGLIACASLLSLSLRRSLTSSTRAVGPQLRARSRVARSMEQHEGQVLADDVEPQMTEVEMP